MNSITQTNKFHTLSDRYQVITTQDIINQVESKGWEVKSAIESRPRKVERLGYQSHLIRLTHPDLPIALKGTHNESRPELIIVNSNDGTRALRMMLGLFRMACLNGIFSGLSFKEFRASHTKSGVGRISEGLGLVLDNAGEECRRVEELSDIQLTNDQVNSYIGGCVEKRLESVKGIIDMIGNTNPRRVSDLYRDAYTILNRGQELMIRGGFTYQMKLEDKEGLSIFKRNTARATYSIPKAIELNRFAVESMNQIIGGN